MNVQREQRREAYFRLYWSDVHEWKKAALCHAAGLPDTAVLMHWDELMPRERAAVRAEIVWRVHAYEVVEGRELDRLKPIGAIVA